MGGSVGVGGYFCRWAPSRPWARWAALTTSRLRPDLTVDLESGRTWNNPTSVRFFNVINSRLFLLLTCPAIQILPQLHHDLPTLIALQYQWRMHIPLQPILLRRIRNEDKFVKAGLLQMWYGRINVEGVDDPREGVFLLILFGVFGG